MKLTLWIAVICATAMVVGVAGQGNITTSCQFSFVSRENNVTYNFDLSSLILSGQQYNGYDLAYAYTMNVCGTVACVAGMPAAVCQSPLSTMTPFHNLGYYTPGTWNVINVANATKGIVFTLANGDACTNSRRVSNIYFDCDPSAVNPQNVNMSVDSVLCTYNFHIRTSKACPTSPIPPPPPPPPSGPSSSGLSGGSIFLIILLVLSVVYVAGGCIFRRVSYGVGGMEACPNHELWTALPGYVTDGCKYFYAKITCRNQYEAVK